MGEISINPFGDKDSKDSLGSGQLGLVAPDIYCWQTFLIAKASKQRPLYQLTQKLNNYLNEWNGNLAHGKRGKR